ncbi:glycosyltransferase family 2 protein [Horticoccus luteus]|uniref:Glycosyltransferase family 2 protein n=1 Tax=Horticoccus luteus TaxID=2862869 RepID=A0A8F9TZ16_9BACT|nr:glycosyltransferase family A protein [Horticoccus luteus]QYM80494.1 glycosyltransferase family 2 protein [Horticoccus luteus]
MTAAPQITLLVPCYNAARFLPRLMESVRGLTRPFDAILCYDDGSRDDTVAVARSLGLEIITGQPNAGVAHARNQLAAAARTEWIHFHDADDLICSSFLERLAPACDAQHDVVSCDADWVDEIARNLMVPWRYDPAALASTPLPHLLRNSMGLNNSIIRRSAWTAVGGCDESLQMWEDADVHIRLARNGARFHHVSEVLTISLRHADSFSHDHRRSWGCRVDALERYALAPGAGDIAPALVHESEHAASALALLGDRPTAERALALCRRLGARPPTTRNPLLKLLKPFVPAYSLLRLQATRRRRSA